MREWGSTRTVALAALVAVVPVLCFAALCSARGQRAQARTPTAEAILEMENRLAALGYWAGSADGSWDSANYHGLVAFQKAENRKRTGRLTYEDLIAIRTASSPVAHEPGYYHVEVDLTRQILFLVHETGATSHVLPISSGTEKPYAENGETGIAHTPRGRFEIERKIRGWRKSRLGLLYYPGYIHGGVAIHGSPSVPTRPASHGCIRIPMYAAREFADLTPIGTVVLVYE